LHRSRWLELSVDELAVHRLTLDRILKASFGFHERDRPPSSQELAATWRPYIETCIEAFGAERCMFESNFPPDKQSCGYTELWNAFKHLTKKASAAEKTALYGGTVAKVYRLIKP